MCYQLFKPSSFGWVWGVFIAKAPSSRLVDEVCIREPVLPKEVTDGTEEADAGGDPDNEGCGFLSPFNLNVDHPKEKKSKRS